MGTKGKKVSINHLNRRTEEWVRMPSNGEEEESMMEKLDHNITPFVQLSSRLNTNHPLLTAIHPWWVLEVPGLCCHILHRWCMSPEGYRPDIQLRYVPWHHKLCKYDGCSTHQNVPVYCRNHIRPEDKDTEDGLWANSDKWGINTWSSPPLCDQDFSSESNGQFQCLWGWGMQGKRRCSQQVVLRVQAEEQEWVSWWREMGSLCW